MTKQAPAKKPLPNPRPQPFPPVKKKPAKKGAVPPQFIKNKKKGT